MALRLGKVLAALSAALAVSAAVALAAGSGGPKAPHGKAAQLVASGVATPTSFAFGGGQVFFSDGTPPNQAPGVGGVYVIKVGHATKLAGSPAVSFGITWHKGTLYVGGFISQTSSAIEAWSGWNGTTFTKHKTIYTAPNGFPGFNGLAFGHDGRLYVGVDVGMTNDHGPAKAPYQYDILSMTAAGKGVKVIARGMRQPWQFAFPSGSSSPYVSDLGQDAPPKLNPRDFVLRIKAGQNYGFPKCNWKRPKACKKYTKPFQFFAPHTDPMGLAIVGKRLYISEFGAATPPQVVSIPLGGGKARVELRGFGKGRNIVALGATGKWLYVGETASGPTSLGAIYRIKVK